MYYRIGLKAFGYASSLFLSVTFALCVVWDLLFPEYAMRQSWQALLPGFHWLDWKSVTLGLIEAFAYGGYLAFVWVPLYNLFARRASTTP